MDSVLFRGSSHSCGTGGAVPMQKGWQSWYFEEEQIYDGPEAILT